MTQQDAPQPQNPVDQELAWGGQQPAAKAKWSGKKTAAAVAIAIGVAAAGGIAVYASTGTAGTAAPQGMGGGFGGGGMRGGGGAGGVMDALHGEFTISDGSNGYKTAIMQTGQVTAISDTSLTAKSTDGYTKVYTIDAGTVFGNNGSVSDIKSGATVTVVATPEGSNATADSVMDRSQMPQGGQGGMPPGQGPGGS
jgi:hypothetical protein